MARVYFVRNRLYYETSDDTKFVRNRLVTGSTTAGGGGDTNITSTAGSLSITGFAATIQKAKSVTATAGSLTLSPANVTVNASTSVTAAVDTLTLTSFNATVVSSTAVTATASSLTLTPNNVTVESFEPAAAGLSYLPTPVSFAKPGRPVGPIQIDKTNPFAKDLNVVDTFQQTQMGNIAPGSPKATVSPSSWSFTPHKDYGLVGSGGTTDYEITRTGVGRQPRSLLGVFYFDHTTTDTLITDRVPFGRGIEVESTTSYITAYIEGNTDLSTIAGFNGAESGWVTFVISHDGKDYARIKLLNTSGRIRDDETGAFDRIGGGASSDTLSVTASDGAALFASWEDRFFSDAEMVSLLRDPFQFIQRPGIRTYRPVSITSTQATLGSLTLTGNNVTVNNATGITTGTVSKTLTSFNTTVETSVNVTAGAGSLTLTPNNVTVSAGSGLQVTRGSLTLTPLNATVNKSSNVTASVATLTLQPRATSIMKTQGVTTTVVSLSLSPRAATISKGIIARPVTATLALSSYNVTLVGAGIGATGFYRNVAGNDTGATTSGAGFFDDVSGNDPDANTSGGGFFS